MIPIFLIHETTTYSTTPVLDLRMGQAPYFPKGSLRPRDDNLSTTSVLDPQMGPAPYLSKRIFFSLVHETAIDRLLRY